MIGKSDFGSRKVTLSEAEGSEVGRGALLRLGAFVLMLFALALPAQAQVSIGAQVGDPTALTLRTPAQAAASWTGALAFDDGAVFLMINRQYEYPLQGSPLHYYVAPGGFLGSTKRDDLSLGAAANVGINFYQERFEIFLQVTPALRVLPETDFGVGATIGARYAL